MGEFVIGYMFLMAKNFRHYLKAQAAHSWESIEQEEIGGKTVGIVGAGAVGQEVAKRAVALGMRVIGTKRTPSRSPTSSRSCRPLAWMSCCASPTSWYWPRR